MMATKEKNIVDIQKDFESYEPMRKHQFMCFIYNKNNEIAIPVHTIIKCKHIIDTQGEYLSFHLIKTIENSFNDLEKIIIKYLNPKGTVLGQNKFNVINFVRYKSVLNYSKSGVIIEKFVVKVKGIE